LKIGDYLSMDAEREARLKELAVFSPRKEESHIGAGTGISPFDQKILDSIVPKANQTRKKGVLYPRASMVHLSQRCNHSCPGCYFGKERNKKDVFLAPDKFPELLKYLHALKVKFIHLGEGGEDTLHPKFDEFTRRCIDEGFELSLLTNASSIPPNTIQLLLQAFSVIRVALDASEVGVYDRIHRPAKHREFEKVLANLDGMVAERNRRKSHLVLGAEVRLCQANMNFTEQIVQLAKDLGFDYIQFLFERNDTNRLLPDQKTQARRLIRELVCSFHPFPIYGTEKYKKPKGGCLLATSLLVITPSGDTYPCPHFHRRSDVTSLGNIFSLPPEELWFGGEHHRMIRRLSQGECHIEGCRWRITPKLV
jgi:radical SAM protein with 4Fe4S-binding SPASM domain